MQLCPTPRPVCGRSLTGTDQHGRVLIVVDHPDSIGALPVAVARTSGHEVTHLPGLAMRRIADLSLRPSQNRRSRDRRSGPAGPCRTR